MSNGKPNDRLPAQKLAAGSADANLFAVEQGAGGWKLTRRNLLSAALAALVARQAAAQTGSLSLAHGGAVTALVLGTDGSTVFTGSLDGTIKLWRMPPGAYYRTINAQAPVQALAVSPSLLFSGSSADNDIRVWSFDGVLQRKLSGHTGPVTALAAAPDGSLLASASKDKTIWLWSMPAGVLLYSINWGSVPLQLAISPDGELLVGCAELATVVRIWQAPEGQRLNDASTYEPVVVAVSPDGRMFASGRSDGGIRLFPLPLGYPQLQAMSGHTGAVSALAFSADGRVLISAGTDKTIRWWRVADGTAMGVQTAAHNDTVTALALTRDGQVISASKDKTVKLWNTTAGLTFVMYFIDLAANDSSVKGSTYTLGGVQYTVPCGTALPSGAACTCNCVPGTGQPCSCVGYACSCVGYACSCVGYVASCTLRGICTCNPQGCSCIGNW